ncbi:hypothetical protein Fsol_00295 [Candidatus Fokinia solitaria]|uniref:Uncharacterized protein n=1 Tax=Candidatus Fokinia solitaria TaxID=1802984 RepID=A0A2U8BRW5_9RICK|nr:hypothetical protein Fsol_00295 [Candidatus Fokinia solitaria]
MKHVPQYYQFILIYLDDFTVVTILFDFLLLLESDEMD